MRGGAGGGAEPEGLFVLISVIHRKRPLRRGGPGVTQVVLFRSLQGPAWPRIQNFNERPALVEEAPACPPSPPPSPYCLKSLSSLAERMGLSWGLFSPWETLGSSWRH